jgi:hypothetical protein
VNAACMPLKVTLVAPGAARSVPSIPPRRQH